MALRHALPAMTATPVMDVKDLRPAAASPRLLGELHCLRLENAQLREENRHLRSALDSYIARARSTALFGPIEMTAGTCVGSACHDPAHR